MGLSSQLQRYPLAYNQITGLVSKNHSPMNYDQLLHRDFWLSKVNEDTNFQPEKYTRDTKSAGSSVNHIMSVLSTKYPFPAHNTTTFKGLFLLLDFHAFSEQHRCREPLTWRNNHSKGLKESTAILSICPSKYFVLRLLHPVSLMCLHQWWGRSPSQKVKDRDCRRMRREGQTYSVICCSMSGKETARRLSYRAPSFISELGKQRIV